jgi:hypothetical protein
MAKLLAWGAAFTAVDGSIHAFTAAVDQAGGVPMERTLQRLYNTTINFNQAFSNGSRCSRRPTCRT